MMDWWQQWQDNLEDLMIVCYALPVYQMHMVKKALRFQDLVKRRKNAMSLLICRMMSCWRSPANKRAHSMSRLWFIRFTGCNEDKYLRDKDEKLAF